MTFAERIENKMATGKPVKDFDRFRYWHLRHTNPMIRFKWEAEISAHPSGDGLGMIEWPDGRTTYYAMPRHIA